MPTVADRIDLTGIAKACGYPRAVSVDTPDGLDRELKAAQSGGELCLIEVKCRLGARSDLGRPTTSSAENKRMFMDYLRGLSLSKNLAKGEDFLYN